MISYRCLVTERFSEQAELDELFGEVYLQKVGADGMLRGEEEYRKVLIEVALLIAGQGSKGLKPEHERLVADVNAVVSGSPFHQSTKGWRPLSARSGHPIFS